MKKLLLIFALCSVGAVAQQIAPNCVINFGPWTDTNMTPVSFNGSTNCAYWVMSYQVSGFSAVSLEFDSAVGVQGAPGSFGLFQGTVTSGSNPSTSVACSTPANCTATFTGVVSYYRVRFTSHTGNGTIQGTLQGYKTYQGLGGNVPSTGSGCPGTSGTPCVVDGVTAAGSPPTTPPVLEAGTDGTNVRTIKTDTSGNTVVVQSTPASLQAAVSGPTAAGSPPTTPPVLQAGSDGTNLRTVKTDSSGNLQEALIGDGTFNVGQQAVTATAAALPTATARAACVMALPGNTINIFVGPSGVTTSTGLPLQPGQSMCQPVSNTNLFFVVASTTGASVAWTLVN